jgi:hypothetical protein
MVESFLTMCEALSSISSPKKGKRKKENEYENKIND